MLARFLGLAALLSIVVATAASAHVTLLSTQPMAGVTTNGVAEIVLNFKSALVEGATAIDLQRIDRRRDGKTRIVSIPMSNIVVGADHKTITVSIGRRLTKGAYVVIWRARAADGAEGDGRFDFRVD